MLQGGAKNVALGANMGHVGAGVTDVTKGILDNLGVGTRGAGFLTSLMGSETATDPRTTTDELAHHLGAGVKTFNASGTNPRMMLETAGTAVGSRINSLGFPDSRGFASIDDVQNAVNTQFNANNTNFAGTGEPNMDAVPPTLTQEQMNVYNQLPNHLKQAFIQGIADGSYSPYEMERQMGY